ncbi:hypothetical protein [Haloarchaeobius amylolyticus]|uniref:hypothetical protein n=1 Tax=Haloarchaeobius amylolyticus TaxID=1198296 RepID=UPI002270617A|nr:hypothetical protein [Haloarchaeobius amylolyticus]
MTERTAKAVTEDDPAYDWTRTDGGVRIYDPENPDAWVEMEFEAGVPPEKRLFMVCDECGAVAPQPTRPGNCSVCGECQTEFATE